MRLGNLNVECFGSYNQEVIEKLLPFISTGLKITAGCWIYKEDLNSDLIVVILDTSLDEWEFYKEEFRRSLERLGVEIAKEQGVSGTDEIRIYLGIYETKPKVVFLFRAMKVFMLTDLQRIFGIQVENRVVVYPKETKTIEMLVRKKVETELKKEKMEIETLKRELERQKRQLEEEMEKFKNEREKWREENIGKIIETAFLLYKYGTPKWKENAKITNYGRESGILLKLKNPIIPKAFIDRNGELKPLKEGNPYIITHLFIKSDGKVIGAKGNNPHIYSQKTLSKLCTGDKTFSILELEELIRTLEIINLHSVFWTPTDIYEWQDTEREVEEIQEETGVWEA